jgi:hydrogenase maturation protein HypF
MELEACARSFQHEKSINKFNNLPSLHSDFSRFFANRGGNWEILTAEFVKMVVDGMSKNEQMAYIAHQFHCNLIGSLSQLLVRLADQTALRRIVLAGGCMQNTLLLDGLTECLEAAGLDVYTGNLLPVNDGAISAGQALIGGLQHVSCNTYEGDRGTGRSR